MLYLWLDDRRPIPSKEWISFKTAPDMIEFLDRVLPTFKRDQVELRISLDHDLGACEACQQKHEDRGGFGLLSECEHCGTGYDVCKFLEEYAFVSMNEEELPLMNITVHSDNASARPKMLQAIANIERFLQPL